MAEPVGVVLRLPLQVQEGSGINTVPVVEDYTELCLQQALQKHVEQEKMRLPFVVDRLDRASAVMFNSSGACFIV